MSERFVKEASDGFRCEPSYWQKAEEDWTECFCDVAEGALPTHIKRDHCRDCGAPPGVDCSEGCRGEGSEDAIY